MTLIFGSLVALVYDFTLGRRRLALVVIGLVWYASLAIQTAHLARPGVKGFFGIDGPGAIQGRWLGRYWLSQILILALIVALFHLGHTLRRRVTAGQSPD